VEIGPFIENRFGDALEKLVVSRPPSKFTEKDYGLYERFRPKIPGKREEGASGKLDLDLIRKMFHDSTRNIPHW
jgi:hypothetical protein